MRSFAYIVLLAAAMTSANAQVPLSSYVDANGFIDVQKLTCAQLAGTFQEDADALTTWYSGPLPERYSPMRKEGSIVLGTGGDGTKLSRGYFFEGVMTAGYPPDAADNAVQADIVAAGYLS